MVVMRSKDFALFVVLRNCAGADGVRWTQNRTQDGWWTLLGVFLGRSVNFRSVLICMYNNICMSWAVCKMCDGCV